MIYTCDTKCCHFIFFSSAETRVCPDCGKHSIRPSTLEELCGIAFIKRKTLPNVVLGRVSLTVFSCHVRLRLLV